MYDRFKAKKTREKQASSITESDWERMSTSRFIRTSKAQEYAMKVRELMKLPNYYPTEMTRHLLSELERGEFNKLLFLKWRSLDCALRSRPTFIGPIQRKVRPITEKSKKWRANAESFNQMSANRPLKPP